MHPYAIQNGAAWEVLGIPFLLESRASIASSIRNTENY
jgi:hypothetical protein